MKILAHLLLLAALGTWPAAGQDLWRIARNNRFVHRFSTLFTAQNVRDYLSTEEGLAEAIEWCKKTGITKVYLEAYRSKYRAERPVLIRARERFRKAGFQVSGCVTTTKIGKISNGWNLISCYTNRRTQEQLRSIFRYAAGIFNEIMIDDFWFTDCTCAECDTARRARKVTIDGRVYPVQSDTWEDYRGELMTRLSRSHVLGAAKSVNPRARLIVKYPQWYDRFQERGYDVVRETRDFDRIWVGTETRDRPRGCPQYRAYFLLRWLGGIGGAKTGGGWYDPLRTTEKTYLEQARQTVLGGASESMLFCYGALHQNFGPADVAALRPYIPELLRVAGEVRKRTAIGIAAYKPPNSHPEDEAYIYDYIGMLGLPLAPCHTFPADAPAAFFSIHSLKDPDFAARLEPFIASGKPVLLTGGLARRLTGKVRLDKENVQILHVGGQPVSLLGLSQTELDRLREPLLKPLHTEFHAPAEVALYLFKDGSWVVENFGDREAEVALNGRRLRIGAREWALEWK